LRQPVSDRSGNAPPVYRGDLLSLHKSLVDIESITGNENEVGVFLAEFLKTRGYHTTLQPLPSSSNSSSSSSGGQRCNVVAWPGSSDHPSPRLLLTSHIDVVPPYIPYKIDADADEISTDTVIHGRGSVDAKASIAAQITALEQLLQAGEINKEDVMLLYVVGEETTGDGMRFYSESLQQQKPPVSFDAVIFGEPTENKLACGHKGHMACTLTAKGKAGHSGYPWLGKSATELLIRALMGILDRDLGSSDRFGNTTVNVGILEGGVAANVIPESAFARVAIRVATAPQLTGQDIVLERIEEVIKGVDPEALSMHCDNGYGAVECNCDVEGECCGLDLDK